MKVDLVDFVSIKGREYLLEKFLTVKDSTVEIDACHLKHRTGNEEYSQLLLTAKFFAERFYNATEGRRQQ